MHLTLLFHKVKQRLTGAGAPTTKTKRNKNIFYGKFPLPEPVKMLMLFIFRIVTDILWQLNTYFARGTIMVTILCEIHSCKLKQRRKRLSSHLLQLNCFVEASFRKKDNMEFQSQATVNLLITD